MGALRGRARIGHLNGKQFGDIKRRPHLNIVEELPLRPTARELTIQAVALREGRPGRRGGGDAFRLPRSRSHASAGSIGT